MAILLLTACALSLAAAPATAAEVDPPATLAIDFSSVDRPTFERLEAAGIYQALVLRLVSEKVALVDPHDRAIYTLRIEPSSAAGELQLTATGPGGARRRSLDIRSLDQDAVRLKVVQVAVELVRQVVALSPPAVRPEELRLSMRAELGVAVLVGGDDSGPLLRLVALRRIGPVEVGVSGLLHRPIPSPRTLRVSEWGAFGVVGTGERALGRRVRVGAGLELGVLGQRASYTGPDGEDAKARTVAAAAVHADVAWRVAAGWRIGAQAGALLSRGWVHEDSSGRLFRTPGLRPFAGLACSYGREVRR